MHVVTALVVFVAWLAGASSARASQCGPLFEFFALPENQSQAPRNTRVWIPSYPAAQRTPRYQWHDAEGAQVAFSLKRILVATQSLEVLTPDEPLRFPATYHVEACWDADPAHCSPVTTFTTTEELDEQTPDLPDVEEREAISGKKARLAVFAVRGDALIIADADGAGLQSPLEAEGAHLAAVTASSQMALGTSPCVPRSFEGDSADVRFGSFDLAGNFSGYTEPVSVDLPEANGCALGAQHGGGWLMALWLAVWRRLKTRRARRTAGTVWHAEP